MSIRVKFSFFICHIVLCWVLVPSVALYAADKTKIVSRQNDNAISFLQAIMQGVGAARLTQYVGDGSHQGLKEQGVLYWSGAKKCVRVEMDNGVIYLYTTGGMHIKEPNKNWVHVPLPNDWVSMLLEPQKIVEEKQAKVDAIDPTSYGLFLEEGGRFIQLFWTRSQVKGWIIGTFEQGVSINETIVELTPVQGKKLPDSAWAPESSFLDIN